jgi:hypothetical protein
MSRIKLHVVLLFVAGLLSAAASKPAPHRPSLIRGINIPSIPGAPFSATVVLEFEQVTEDGDLQVFRTIGIIARDSKGRTHNETRRLMPEEFHGSPPLLGVRLYDPATKTRIIYDPSLHLARRQIVPESAKPTRAENVDLREEELGASTLDGLPTKGTRRTLTLDRKQSGVGRKTEIEEEEWFSQDLHINLLVRYSDPRIGTETLGISNLKREEPPASLFDVPAGYKIFDVSAEKTPGSPSEDSNAEPEKPASDPER